MLGLLHSALGGLKNVAGTVLGAVAHYQTSIGHQSAQVDDDKNWSDLDAFLSEGNPDCDCPCFDGTIYG